MGEYELRMGNPASMKIPMLGFVQEVHKICDSINHNYRLKYMGGLVENCGAQNLSARINILEVTLSDRT